MEFKSIAIDQIEFNDPLFKIKNNHPVNIDQENFEMVFNPVWLHQLPGGYRIVDGFQILAAIQANNLSKTIPSLVFKSDHDLQDLWLLRINKRIAEQNLPALALLDSLNNLLKHLGANEPKPSIGILIRSLGYPVSDINAERLHETLNHLKTYCHFCDLYALTYREISGLSRRKPEKLQAMAVLLEGLSLKGNKLQSMLQLFDDLEKGYGQTPEQLCKKEELQKLLEDIPIHSRYKALKNYLSSLRWPILEKAQKDWQKTVKEFTDKNGLQISIDPLFENNEIEFIFTASNPEQYKEILTKLNHYASNKNFLKLFDFI